MAWDKDDYLAVALISGILIFSILAILWVTGNIPQSDDTVFPFGLINVKHLYAYIDVLHLC